jgi:hypothetical protein
MPTTDDETVRPRWTQGPPAFTPELVEALKQMTVDYQRAVADADAVWLPGPGKCAPAIGVHQRCEHDR